MKKILLFALLSSFKQGDRFYVVGFYGGFIEFDGSVKILNLKLKNKT